MPRYIDADAFIEDIKTEAMNLFWDGMKGTPRPRKELYDIIDRINEQPTADVVPKSEVENLKLEHAGFEGATKQIIEALKATLPPCKIGDTVYTIRNYNNMKKVQSGKVSAMYYVGKEMKLCIVVRCVARGEWGKDVFGTYEEAERSLQI